MLPVVAIVGRPNVGKSTLMNRLAGGRRALVGDLPGVTRDRHYEAAEVGGRACLLVDTGGFCGDGAAGIDALVADQVRVAVDEADLALLVVDAREGLTAEDRDLARWLRRAGRAFVVVANKVDAAGVEAEAAEAHALGADVVAVSAEHGRNVTALEEAIAARLPPPRPPIPAPEGRGADVRVALVGRPNAGKSSLLNALCGRPRALVHEAPGTTRDPVDAAVERGDGRFWLIDTAGLRRSVGAAPPTERIAMLRAARAIPAADVCALIVDASAGVGAQDAHVGGLCERAGRALVIVLNKWDLVEGSLVAAQSAAREQVSARLPFFDHAPLVFASAKTGFGVPAVLDRAREAFDAARMRVATADLNRFFEEVVADRPPPSPGGRPVRLFYVTQPRVAPPTFVVAANRPADVPEAYRRFLLGRLRARWGFRGTPLRLELRARRGRGGRAA